MGRALANIGLRHLSLIVAIVMLLANVPSTAGIVVLSGPSRPEITINICRPIEMLDRVSNTLLARPATVLPEIVLCDVGWTAVREAPQLVDCAQAILIARRVACLRLSQTVRPVLFPQRPNLIAL
jgi:hypothetical protein